MTLPMRCLQLVVWMQLQCYTEEERNSVLEDDHWKCPAYKGLSHEEKEDRSKNSGKELIKVTWDPIWEPKEQMDLQGAGE